MYSTIAVLEEKYREETIACYKHLHRHPEASYDEKETSAFVFDVLSRLPFDEIKTNVGGYGVTALLKGGGPATVALRADMDALNIEEKSGADYASEKPMLMHACGHDGHTAMLLGAAKVLCEMKDRLKGSIRFIFQPAEEKTPRGGAQGMIEAGVLENPQIDAVLGMHLWPSLETGTIGLQCGAVSAASDHLTINIKGRASHGAIPDEGIDAVLAVGATVVALQGIVARNVPPKESAVITIGTMTGGSRYNVIAENALLDGTVRTFNPSVREKMPFWIERTAKGTAESYGASAEVEYVKGYPSVMNSPEIVSLARQAAINSFGEGALCGEMALPPIGEDFAFYSLAAPSAFAMLGCRPANVAAKDMPPLHNDKFLPDIKALGIGIRYISAAAAYTAEQLSLKK